MIREWKTVQGRDGSKILLNPVSRHYGRTSDTRFEIYLPRGIGHLRLTERGIATLERILRVRRETILAERRVRRSRKGKT